VYEKNCFEKAVIRLPIHPTLIYYNINIIIILNCLFYALE